MPVKRRKSSSSFKIFLSLIFLNAILFSYIGGKVLSNKSEGSLPSSISAKQEAQKIAASCENPNTMEGCYSEQFKKLTQKTNIKFARETLSVLQDIDPVHSRGCHLIAHYITITETKKDPSRWKELLKQVDSNSCTGGYVHGILEAHIGSNPDFKITASEVPKICSYLPDANAGGDINCSHNLGHILLAQENNDIRQGVDICSGVEGERMRYECLSGVFMERMTRLNLEAHGIANRVPWNQKNTDEMEKICLEYTGQAAVTCWREIAHMFVTLNRNQPQKVFDYCNRAPEAEAAQDCYLHSSSIMVVSSNFDPKNLNKVCTVFTEEDPVFDMCMSHMIGGMIMSSEKFSDTVITLCNNSTETYMATCYKKLGRSLAGAVPSAPARAKICSKAHENYRNLCSQPANT